MICSTNSLNWSLSTNAYPTLQYHTYRQGYQSVHLFNPMDNSSDARVL